MIFRLQYLTLDQDRIPFVSDEIDLPAPDADEAVSKARVRDWPDKAIGWRIVDLDGEEIATWSTTDVR